jgi:hypothetical protein
MISNKRILLILATAVAIIAVVAVVPGHHRLVSHASPGNLAILRCSATPSAPLTVYSIQSNPEGYDSYANVGNDCAEAVYGFLSGGWVQVDYGEVLVPRVEGDRQISTWVFTTNITPPAGN